VVEGLLVRRNRFRRYHGKTCVNQYFCTWPALTFNLKFGHSSGYSDVSVKHINPMSVVLRFPNVAIAQSAFETALGLKTERFEASRNGPYSYAQVGISDEGDTWATAASVVERIGPAVANLLMKEEIGQPNADIAVEFSEGRVMTSLTIPRAVVATLGRWAFDIEISVYLTSAD
jgi:hypothetical protein